MKKEEGHEARRRRESNDLDVDRSYFMTRIILGRGIAPSF